MTFRIVVLVLSLRSEDDVPCPIYAPTAYVSDAGEWCTSIEYDVFHENRSTVLPYEWDRRR